MSATVFYAGASELATLTNTFSVGGVATDPTTISLTITHNESGTTTTYTYAAAEITRTTTGVYTKDITCSASGTWQYQWIGTGAASDTVMGTWEVQETTMGKLYCPVDALKSHLGITSTTDDAELHTACYAASRAVEQYCQRIFWRTATGTVRTFENNGNYWVFVLPAFSDLVSVTTLATDFDQDGNYETVWASTDFQLLPRNPTAAPEARPYTSIRSLGGKYFPLAFLGLGALDTIQVTGVFGWPEIPMGVKMGARLLAAETFKLKDAPFGVAGFGDMGVVRIRDNPKICAYLNPYRRYVALVA